MVVTFTLLTTADGSDFYLQTIADWLDNKSEFTDHSWWVVADFITQLS